MNPQMGGPHHKPKKKTIKQIEALDRQLEEGFETDMRNLFLSSRVAPDKKTIVRSFKLSEIPNS